MTRRVPVPQSTSHHLARWYSQQVLEETPLLRNSFPGWVFGQFGQAAVTIDKAVHLTSRAPHLESAPGAALLGHEYYHVLQQKEMGWWSFLGRYVWHWRPSHIKEGWNHHLEKPAYDRGEEIRRTLEG